MSMNDGNRNLFFIIAGVTAAAGAAWLTVRWRLS